MKKLTLISLAVAAALAICPAALVGQTYDWSITGTGISGNGQITVSSGDVTGITGTLTDLGFTGGTILGITGPGLAAAPSYSWASPSSDTGFYSNPPYAGQNEYDDLLYLANNSPSGIVDGWSGNGGNIVDSAGIVMDVTSGANIWEVQLYNYGSGVNEWSNEDNSNPSNIPEGINGVPVDFTLTSVPEGGAALLYLLLAGGACFGAMFFSRNRFANLASA